MILTGAQIIIEELVKHDVKTIFGYPGGAVLPLYDEIYKNSDRIEHILTAHEQGASHAADGYARVSGKTGVVISTSGPGATNLVTGIANAYLDSVPLVAITGNVPVNLLGKDSFQEVDIMGITIPIVKHNFVVRDINDLEFTLEEAFKIANEGRKGPVLVDIPKNIQVESCEFKGDIIDLPQKEKTNINLESVTEIIKNAKRPFIYAGGGISASDSQDELLELSKRINAPVGLSMMGIDCLPNSYELNLGMCGMHGKYAASVAQDECDVMIVLGARFSDRATGNTKHYQSNKTIIHVDIDISEFNKNIDTHINVCSNLKDFLANLLKILPENCNEEWIEKIREFKKVDIMPQSNEILPYTVIETVSSKMNDDTVVATDVGQHQMWTVQHYRFQKPHTLLTSGGLGTMGFGFGAAIGGCIANNRKRTVFFTSEGSFGMNLNEFSTAVEQKLPIVIILMKNGVLGMVRQWQTMFHGKRYSSTVLDRKTDFVEIAKAFGANGYKINSLDDLENILNNLEPDSPTLIECPINLDEKVLPMIPPGGTVKDIVVKEEK